MHPNVPYVFAMSIKAGLNDTIEVIYERVHVRGDGIGGIGACTIDLYNQQFISNNLQVSD